MKKKCSKCQIEFECKANDIANCDCSKILLKPDTKAYLQSTYADCLCISCLQKTANQFENLKI